MAQSTAAGNVCDDPDVFEALDRWADSVHLWEALPFIPKPGGDGWDLLLQCVARGSEAVKFPGTLAEMLRPWIPAEAWGTVVAAG